MSIVKNNSETSFLKVPAFAIVVYRKVYYETVAFTSLINSLQDYNYPEPVKVLIYDNTDTENWVVNAEANYPGCNVVYRHDITNPGISKAYNFLAADARALSCEWIVFMDQDTRLSIEAVKEYSRAIAHRPDLLLKVPVLKIQEQIFSPSAVWMKKTFTLNHVLPGEMSLRNRTVVNSGLMVNLDLFFSVSGYDESVKLDFADFLFIDRVRKVINSIEVLPLVFSHGFSHFEDNMEQSLTRYKLYVKDLANCPRFTIGDHFSYFMLGILHLLKLTVKFRTLRFLIIKSGGK